MARLHEHQGKALLQDHGITVPRSHVITTAPEAAGAAGDLLVGGTDRVVLKVQAWITGRKAAGGVLFASTPEQAEAAAARLLALRFGNFPVTEVLVEEALPIDRELFVSLTIDDAARAPILLLDCAGGSGIEERAATVARLPVHVTDGVSRAAVQEVVEGARLPADLRGDVVDAIVRVVETARDVEARALEVNPLVTTTDGRVVAADCRVTIDDYAVFRHPELGIEIARELDHPPTALERAAYDIEQHDHRGTFYFAQLPVDEAAGRLVGFHGAGGGGSMMSMDAITNTGFAIANFCDTSGNPSVAKVYRAARIICAQGGLCGYFGSGSGVASQEQYHSAYGLAKAFLELDMPVPVVVRLGGNSEDRAVEILEDACRDLPAPVECYRKDDTPAFCAERFKTLVDAAPAGVTTEGLARRVPAFVGAPEAYHFSIDGGTVWIDHAGCDETTSALVIERSAGLLQAGRDGKPVLAVDETECAARDSELIACEIECRRAGRPVVFVDLPVPLLDGAAGGEER